MFSHQIVNGFGDVALAVCRTLTLVRVHSSGSHSRDSVSVITSILGRRASAGPSGFNPPPLDFTAEEFPVHIFSFFFVAMLEM